MLGQMKIKFSDYGVADLIDQMEARFRICIREDGSASRPRPRRWMMYRLPLPGECPTDMMPDYPETLGEWVFDNTTGYCPDDSPRPGWHNCRVTAPDSLRSGEVLSHPWEEARWELQRATAILQRAEAACRDSRKRGAAALGMSDCRSLWVALGHGAPPAWAQIAQWALDTKEADLAALSAAIERARADGDLRWGAK